MESALSKISTIISRSSVAHSSTGYVIFSIIVSISRSGSASAIKLYLRFALIIAAVGHNLFL